MPVLQPTNKWPFSRNVNMRENLIVPFLKGEESSERANPAAMPSTLMDFGYWDTRTESPTPIGKALIDGRISWQESVLWVLSKRPSSRDNNNIKPLVVVCKFMMLCKQKVHVVPCLFKQDISILSQVDSYDEVNETLVQRVLDNRSKELPIHTYADIWLNSLAETSVFAFSRQDKETRIVVDESCAGSWKLVEFLALTGHLISTTPPKTLSQEQKDRFYDYMGSLETGLIEVLPPLYFKNLFENKGSVHEDYTKSLLRVGDKFSGKDDGCFEVIEILTKAYRIKSEKTGKIRTVPKTVVSAWYQFYRTHDSLSYDQKKSNGVIEHKVNVPIREAATRPVREILNEITVDDKYEHGYDGMLGSIARWLLDNHRQESTETEEQSVVDSPSRPPQDVISIAIELFKDKRNEEAWTTLLVRDGYTDIRSRYAAMNPETLRNMTAAEFDQWIADELWAARTFFCGENIKKLSEEEKKAFAAFIAATKKNPRMISNYLGKGAELPKGVGPVATTELLMKFHPDDYFGYNLLMLQGLKVLGLVESEKIPNVVTPSDYFKLIGLATGLVERLRDAKVPRSFDEPDILAADYITVNEFIWFCKQYREEILKEAWEKIMKTEIKKVEQVKIESVKGFIDQLEKDVATAGLKYAADLLKRFVCAQLAKPFVVLTGLSGSGKTKLAEAFAKWIGVEGTYKIIPIGADWTNNEKLLGYPNALDKNSYVMPDTGVLTLLLDAAEEKNAKLPFFLILDEMNLSHVERYFADFLSAMESDGTIKLYDGEQRYANGRPIPQRLKFPKNLFVIGTMNVDETTYMFSPKVLDRAQVIEFRVSKDEINAFLGSPAKPEMGMLAGNGAQFAEAFLKLAAERKTKSVPTDELGSVKKTLVDLFGALANLGAEFGYRSAMEIVTFVAYYLEASGYEQKMPSFEKEKILNAAIDAAVLQKLLPKLHGSLNHLLPVLEELVGKVSKTMHDVVNDIDTTTAVYKLTYEKLTRMKTRLEKNGFTSFAEA